MKTNAHFPKNCLLIGLLVCGLLTMANVQAQSAPMAKYDLATKTLSLDEKAPFGYIFQLDISPLKFASQATADEFFSNWTTELVSFKVNFEKHTADVILYTRRQPTWMAKDWNVYLAKLPKP